MCVHGKQLSSVHVHMSLHAGSPEADKNLAMGCHGRHAHGQMTSTSARHSFNTGCLLQARSHA